MIEATWRKQGEARFFYGHLVEERQKKTSRHDPSAFRYYFSAFIQAARNVIWTLHSEQKEKWEAWRPKWESTLSGEDKKLLAFTNELRIDEVKRGGANPSVELEEIVVHELLALNFDLGRQHPVQLFNQSAMPGVPSPKVFRPTYYFEHEDGKHEVTALCQRYLVFLEKMLNDFCADNQPASPDDGRH
jgi:hypothetical protein